MIETVVVCTAIILLALRTLYRRIVTRLDRITQGLIRVEGTLGADEWCDLMQPHLSREHLERLRREGVVGRLERVEAAVDPLARAKLDVRRLLTELDEELEEDASNAYEHWQVTKIQGTLDTGRVPDQAEWTKWIHTPFPWSRPDEHPES